ncbi:MAG TPA: YafY family protein [Lichenihabitans sp.]|jgi:predicted DNA-binding transcriptional regulator YafY|nr:YafY family protein [Lichenihabitans sp.]
MRRADRLFDIIQRLRTATGPVTAATLSTELEVTVRTVYRDIATLRARRVPIEGAPGIGYLFRRGFDLPPLMFTADEVEAIAVGARLLRRTGDAGLQSAAASLLSKISVVLPPDTGPHLDDPAMFVSGFGVAAMPEADLALVRAAIRNRRKLRIGYADSTGRSRSPIMCRRRSSPAGARRGATIAISERTGSGRYRSSMRPSTMRTGGSRPGGVSCPDSVRTALNVP